MSEKPAKSKSILVWLICAILILAVVVPLIPVLRKSSSKKLSPMEKRIEEIIEAVRAEAKRGNRSALIDKLYDMPGPFYIIAELLERRSDNSYLDSWKLSKEIAGFGTNATPHMIKVLAGDSSEEVRSFSVEVFGQMDDPLSLPQLTKSLKSDSSYMVRQNIAGMIGFSTNASVVSALIHALASDTAFEVRSASASTLANIGDKSAILPLITSLRSDSENNVRVSAAYSLGQLTNDDAYRALLEALHKDPFNSVRSACANSLRVIKNPDSAEPLIAAMRSDKSPDVRSSAVRAIAALRLDETIAPLIDQFDLESNVSARSALANAFGTLKAKDSLPILIKALKHDASDRVRISAVKAIASIGKLKSVSSSSCVPPLFEAMESDKKKEVRKQAVSAIASLRLPETVEPLIELFEKEAEHEVKSQMASAFGTLKAEKALKHLELALENDAQEQVRKSSAKAIGVIGKHSSLRLLSATVKTEKIPAVRKAIVEALSLCGDESTIRILIEVFKTDSNSGVKAEAVAAMAAYNCEETFTIVSTLLKGPKGPMRTEAIEVAGYWGRLEIAPDLIRIFTSAKDNSDKSKAVSALGFLKTEEALPHILEALSDPKCNSTTEALWALGYIGSRDASSLVSSLAANNAYQEQFYASISLAMLRDPGTIDIMNKNLRSKKENVRLASCIGLVNLNVSDITAELEKQIDTDDSWRKLAAVTLAIKAGTPEAHDLIRDLPPGTDDMLMKAAEDAVAGKGMASLIHLKNMSNGTSRGYLAQLLSILKDPATLPLLEELTNDSNPDARLYSRVSIRHIKMEQQKK